MEIKINDNKTGETVFFTKVEETTKVTLNKLIATALELPAGENFTLSIIKNGHPMSWKVESVDVRQLVALVFEFNTRKASAATV